MKKLNFFASFGESVFGEAGSRRQAFFRERDFTEFFIILPCFSRDLFFLFIFVNHKLFFPMKEEIFLYSMRDHFEIPFFEMLYYKNWLFHFYLLNLLLIKL